MGVFYLTLFYQLGGLAFVGADEPRYARVGEEMNLRSDYVTPTLGFRPWLEKPPLLFWIEAASFTFFGVHEWSARLPVATLALLTLLALALLMFGVVGSRAAVFTVLVLSTSALFFVFARAASTDMPLVATLTMAVICGFQADRSGSPWWGAGAGLGLGLAVLAKGPVALVLFFGIFAAYFLIVQKWGWSWLQAGLGMALFLISATPWYWLVWRENGYDFVATFWINHHLARFVTDVHHHSQPLWYFPVILVVGFFPWICFLGSALWRVWLQRRELAQDSNSLRLVLWLWVLVPLVFFSLSQSKLGGYILPVFPPLAMIVALEWDSYVGGDVVAHRAMSGQFRVLGALMSLLVAVLLWGFHTVYGATTLGVLLVLPIVAGVSLAWVEYRKRRLVGIFFSLVAGMTLFAALAHWKAAPVVDDFHSARDICQSAVSRMLAREPLILYRYFHHSAQYYTGYRATQESIDSLQSLRAYLQGQTQDHYYVLTQESGWQELQALDPDLIEHHGNLYLLRVEPQGQTEGRT